MINIYPPFCSPQHVGLAKNMVDRAWTLYTCFEAVEKKLIWEYKTAVYT
jgi:hypothetical protein